MKHVYSMEPLSGERPMGHFSMMHPSAIETVPRAPSKAKITVNTIRSSHRNTRAGVERYNIVCGCFRRVGALLRTGVPLAAAVCAVHDDLREIRCELRAEAYFDGAFLLRIVDNLDKSDLYIELSLYAYSQALLCSSIESLCDAVFTP